MKILFSHPYFRLMLLSVKAGGIGINLVGASRMILMDVSFNPANDRQALFRIYRLGQTKVCKIYRLVADGTMEHAIFKRQINKMHLAHRVVDEKHCERQYTKDELKELYRYKPNLDHVGSTLKVRRTTEEGEAANNSDRNSQKEPLDPPQDDEILMDIFADDSMKPFIFGVCKIMKLNKFSDFWLFQFEIFKTPFFHCPLDLNRIPPQRR